MVNIEQRIRRISALYGTYNYEMGVDFRESLKICDLGDVFTIANIEKGFDQISQKLSPPILGAVLGARASGCPTVWCPTVWLRFSDDTLHCGNAVANIEQGH